MKRSGPYRLKESADAAPIEFRFDGGVIHGIEGDTVASALLANGVRVVSRSFKFHRPRGVFSAGYEEPNALVQLHSGAHSIPCARATLVPISAGLEVSSGAGWPSLSFDLLRSLDFLHSIFAAGFYNKTFIWPGWQVYEPFIRKLAGFGRAPEGADPDRYESRHAHCDVLVVGGGAAGIKAAKAAATDGQRVILVEQQSWFVADVAPLTLVDNVCLLRQTTAVGYYDHDLVALSEVVAEIGRNRPRERLWMVRAGRVVLATGGVEQPLIFSNNDRPGIMLAGAAHKYLHRHAIAPGRQVILATNNDSAYPVARELHEAGVRVVALVDSRESPPERRIEELRDCRIEVHPHTMPIDTQGFGALKSVTIGNLSSGHQVRARQTRACDALLVSGGWSPALHLFAQAGGKLKYSEITRTLEPVTAHPSIEIVGSAGQPSFETLGERVSPVGDTARQWVDLKHDVTVSDLELAVRENFTAVEHIKRHTTLGMSVDQGKIGQAPGTEVMARVRGVSPSQIGHTTFRPPFMPVTLGAMVGRNVGDLYAPYRRSSLYALQASAGAQFEDFGEWQRAATFARAGETREAAIEREVKLIRQGVGLYDASPLGKIELAGPDALEFADRFYINNLKTLKPGRARYGIMLRETGIIFDDGTIVALDKDRVLLTTTSSGANRVAQWLEEWRQCEWPNLRVVVVPVTEQWATVALTGQFARDILRRLKPACDLSNEGFPHLGFRTTRLLGEESRIYRVSFSGELTYEINVPAHCGPKLWSALLEEGHSFGIAPFGVEALLHARLEKGFLHLGADTDGTTIPDDVGFGASARAKQSHYIGKRSLSLPENLRPDRLQLIGLRGLGAGLAVGSHLRLPGIDEATDGWITSAGILSTDQSPVALALLRAGRAQIDQTVTVHDAGRLASRAQVVAPTFYDPTGTRMNA
jgi:sarcosine oxidase subunit alpha